TCGRSASSSWCPLTFETKEHQPIPARAGDRARGGGKRFVGPALIFEIVVAHGHAVFNALPFADQSCAGDRSVVRWTAAAPCIAAIEVFGNGLETLDRLRL